jgi:Fic family protein
MKAFLKWFNRPLETDTVLKAALAHLWFVTIHPFDDGNGRIARAIADVALARSEASPKRFSRQSGQSSPSAPRIRLTATSTTWSNGVSWQRTSSRWPSVVSR